MFEVERLKSVPGHPWSVVARISSKAKAHYLRAEAYLTASTDEVALRVVHATPGKGDSSALVKEFAMLWDVFDTNKPVRWEGMEKRQGLRDYLNEYGLTRVAAQKKPSNAGTVLVSSPDGKPLIRAIR